MKKYYVGLVGYGMSSRVFHAPLIRAAEGLILKSVVERHGRTSQQCYPDVSVVRSIDALLKDDDIQLVVIATPNNTHFPLAKKALEAGRHVVLDKPFTCTYAEAQELCELAKKKKRILSAFQNRRWDGDFLTACRIMDDGLLGRVVSYESHFDRFRKEPRKAWREQAGEGTGILYDLGSHLIDQALTYFGKPAGVFALVAQQRDGACTDDAFSIDLIYPEINVRLCAGMLVPEENRRFCIRGTSGSYIKHGLDPQEKALKAGGVPGSEGWGVEAETEWGRLISRISGLRIDATIETLAGDYSAYYANVHEAMGTPSKLIVTGEQAAQVIHIIEMARQSALEGRVIKDI